MVTPGFFDSARHESPRWNFSLIQTPLESFDFMVLTSQPKTNTFWFLVWELGLGLGFVSLPGQFLWCLGLTFHEIFTGWWAHVGRNLATIKKNQTDN